MAAKDTSSLDITLPGDSPVVDGTGATWTLEDFPELEDFLRPCTLVSAQTSQATTSLHNSAVSRENQTSPCTTTAAIPSMIPNVSHPVSSQPSLQEPRKTQRTRKLDVVPSGVTQPSVIASSNNQVNSNPVLFQLQTALKTECDSSCVPFTLMGAVKQEPDVLPPMPLSVRTNQLQVRFLRLQIGHCKRVTELYTFYCVQAADIEGDRYKALVAASMSPWQHYGMNCYYDHLHHELINRVEKSVALLESSNAPPTTKRSPPTSPSKTRSSTPVKTANKTSSESRLSSSLTGSMTSVAVQIMLNWYDRNKEHPYPSYDTCEVMARAGNITIEQVKKWFANHRNRSGNTKSLQDIARRRISTKVSGYKRPRSDCSDFLMAANKKSRE